jgi:beta-lactamase class A
MKAAGFINNMKMWKYENVKMATAQVATQKPFSHFHISTFSHCLLIIFSVVSILSSCNTRMNAAQLQRAIIDTLSKQQGFFAVAFKSIATGEILLINEHETFHAASTMKTPVMIEMFRKEAAGELSLMDSVMLKNEFKSIVDSSTYSLNSEDDSEKELYKLIGTKRTLASLIYDMIIVSSNLATNTVIEISDARKVTQTMRRLGASDIQVLRGVEDNKAFEKGLNNTTTAYDLMVIFDKIATGKAVSYEASAKMVQILLNQQFNTIIPAQLPKDVKVAHKTGSITGVHHDSGIVLLPDGRKYVLVILSKDLKDDEAATKAMATVSKMIYDYLVPGS